MANSRAWGCAGGWPRSDGCHRLPALSAAIFSNNVTVELAHRTSLNVRAIGLDGGPFLPPEVFEAMIKRAKVGRGPGLHDDGSHRSFVWDVAVNALNFFDPAFELNDDSVGMVYDYMADYLATGMPDDQGATAPYDLKGQLEQPQDPNSGTRSGYRPPAPSL